MNDHGLSHVFSCEHCVGITIDAMSKRPPKYCPYCGEAVEWIDRNTEAIYYWG